MRTLIGLLAGVLAGAVLAVFLVLGPLDFGGLKIGPWRTNVHIGSPDGPPIVRAIVARRGLLAMSRQETIYYSADTDSSGRTLDARCEYRLVFERQPAARWWSMTLYAEDEFLAVNGLEAHSVSATDIGDVDAFEVFVSETPRGEHWVSPQNAGAFNLTIRLYNPIPAIVADPGITFLPRIERLSCGGTS